MKSIVSYVDRGPWGDATYRGNCSGHLLYDLITYYRPRHVVDPAEGSGTSQDVCAERGIPYFGFDLKTGFDLRSMNLRANLPFPVDLVFFHPPYFRILPYSGSVWGDIPHAGDLSHVKSWSEYLGGLRLMVDSCREALTPNGRVIVLIGDVRDRGSYYSAQAYFHLWFDAREIESVIIKAQHHVHSNKVNYSGRFIPILHEYCIVLRAPSQDGVAAIQHRRQRDIHMNQLQKGEESDEYRHTVSSRFGGESHR